MANRRRMSSRGSRRLFKATARRVNKKNVKTPLRGGVRL